MRELPLACSLDAAALAERRRLIERLAGDVRVDRTLTERGLSVLLRRGPGVRERVKELIALESACCPFLSFALHERDECLELEVTAPAGGREVLAELFA
jgi:MerR family transcriptional regulator, copper efflux regulator